MKSENLGIAFAIVVQQVVKLSADESAANTRLYKVGQQMGLRICDQFNSRQCSYLSPAETIKALIIKISKESLGLSLQLVQQSIRYEKRNHFYNLTYKQANLNKSILGFCQDIDDRFNILQPSYIVAGFIYGILQTMDFYGEVTVVKSQNQRQKIKYNVYVKKDIKQQD